MYLHTHNWMWIYHDKTGDSTSHIPIFYTGNWIWANFNWKLKTVSNSKGNENCFHAIEWTKWMKFPRKTTMTCDMIRYAFSSLECIWKWQPRSYLVVGGQLCVSYFFLPTLIMLFDSQRRAKNIKWSSDSNSGHHRESWT